MAWVHIIPYRKKSWKDKLEGGKNFPKVLKLESNFPCYRALQKMGAKPGDSVVLAPALARALYEIDNLKYIGF